MNTSPTIAVLIPCYNEGSTIGAVIGDYRSVYPDAEIYVYDNNSSDDTAVMASAAGAIVRRESRQGKGNVLRSMFMDIDADCYVLTDGDDTYPAADTLPMAQAVLAGDIDMAIGDRLSSTYFTENKRQFHNGGNRLVRSLINSLFDADVKDILTGSRVFSRRFVKNFPISSAGFEIETEMTIHALDKGFRIKEFPVQYRDRPAGSVSKLNTFGDGFKVICTIFSLLKEYRPLLFFSVISAVLAVVSVVLAVPVLFEYFRTGLVPRFPTLIVSCFILLFALLMLVTGLLLDSIQRKHRDLCQLHLLDFRSK